jgi:predicted protein tyrosine phosphatase
MISSVDFVFLDVFEALAPAPDMLAISIGDHDQAAPANLGAFQDGLRLEFLDCDEVDVAMYDMPAGVLFSAQQLDALAAFVRRHDGSRVPLRLVVHCRLGSSRSSAVALVAHHLTGCDFPRLQDAHHANRHVLRMATDRFGAISAPDKSAGPEPHPYLPTQLQI